MQPGSLVDAMDPNNTWTNATVVDTRERLGAPVVLGVGPMGGGNAGEWFLFLGSRGKERRRGREGGGAHHTEYDVAAENREGGMLYSVVVSSVQLDLKELEQRASGVRASSNSNPVCGGVPSPGR